MEKRLVLFGIAVIVSILGLLAFAAIGQELDLKGYELVKMGMCNAQYPCTLFTKDGDEYLLVFDPTGRFPLVFLQMGKDGKQKVVWEAQVEEG